MPISTASTCWCRIGKPSVWVRVSLWPPRATRYAVSPPALISRSRIRLPGLVRKTSGSAGTRPLIRWWGYFTSPASPPSSGLRAPISMNFVDMPAPEDGDGELLVAPVPPSMSIPPMCPMSWPEELDELPEASPMCIPPMPCFSSAKTSSGVPVTPSSQSSRTTTHSSSYDSGSLGSSTINGACRPRSSWTPTCGWKK